MKINPDDFKSEAGDEGIPPCQISTTGQWCDQTATQEAYVGTNWGTTLMCDEHYALMQQASKDESTWFGDERNPNAEVPEWMKLPVKWDEL